MGDLVFTGSPGEPGRGVGPRGRGTGSQRTTGHTHSSTRSHGPGHGGSVPLKEDTERCIGLDLVPVGSPLAPGETQPSRHRPDLQWPRGPSPQIPRPWISATALPVAELSGQLGVTVMNGDVSPRCLAQWPRALAQSIGIPVAMSDASQALNPRQLL